MFQYGSKQPVKAQKQNGSSDCGVFTIAMATAIAFSKNQIFDQKSMRAYLVNCLNAKHFTLVP